MPVAGQLGRLQAKVSLIITSIVAWIRSSRSYVTRSRRLQPMSIPS